MGEFRQATKEEKADTSDDETDARDGAYYLDPSREYATQKPFTAISHTPTKPIGPMKRISETFGFSRTSRRRSTTATRAVIPTAVAARLIFCGADDPEYGPQRPGS